MSLRRWSLLGMVVLLGACQVPVKPTELGMPKTTVRPKSSASPKSSPSANVAASPSTTPSTATSASAPPQGLVSASPSAGSTLPTRTLTGTIRIDAHYVLSKGAGTLVSNNSGNVLALKGGTLISDKGLGLVANNGGNIKVPTGAAAGYRVAADTTVGLGQMLPAQGVAVVAISLETGLPLGEPVLTDASGSYAVTVPEALQENVRLLSAVPALNAEDPNLHDTRLQYSVITAARTTGATVIDEDTAMSTQFLRFCFTKRLMQFLLIDDPNESLAIISSASLPEFLKPQLTAVLSELRQEAKAAGIDAMTAEQQEALAQKVNDAVQTRLDFPGLTVETQYSAKWTAAPTPALPVLVDLMKRNREGAAAKLTADPLFFKASPYLLAATILKGFEILKPSDVNDFAVREYLVRNELGMYPLAEKVMKDIDTLQDAQTGIHYGDRLEASGNSIMAHFIQAVFFNKNGAKDLALTTIRGHKK